jgi:hypothetical protein
VKDYKNTIIQIYVNDVHIESVFMRIKKNGYCYFCKTEETQLSEENKQNLKEPEDLNQFKNCEIYED